MRIVNCIIVALFIVISGNSAHASAAGCSEAIVETVLKYFSVPAGGETRDSACMRIPDKFDKTIVVVAHAPIGYSFAESDGPLPYYAAVLFGKKRRVEASYVGGIVEDGAIQISPGTISWEKINYQLSKNVQAFALMVDGFRLSGAMDGELGPDLTLFAYNGNTLHPVMNGLSMLQARCLDLPCKESGAKRLEKKVKLALSGKQSNGFRDFILTGTRFDGTVVRYQAKYDGLSYSLDGWDSKWIE